MVNERSIFRSVVAFLFFFFVGVLPQSRAENLECVDSLQGKFSNLKLYKGLLNLRYGVWSPPGEPVADVFFLHGFGDRMDNHGPLFQAYVKKGYRVISFDYPKHGESKGLLPLGFFTLKRLAAIAAQVEKTVLGEQVHRPLIVVGWSTGGLLALRMFQSQKFEKFSRVPSALILQAPGVSVRKTPFTFGKWGIITQDTLTRNTTPPHEGKIRPLSPFFVPGFAMSIMLNSWLSQSQELPETIPTFVLMGGDSEDRYAITHRLREWTHEQKALGVHLSAIQIPGGFHELDNEPFLKTDQKTWVDVGDHVRRLMVSFADLQLGRGDAKNELLLAAKPFTWVESLP